MEDFSLDSKKNSAKSSVVNMSVSCICRDEKGDRYAFVTFSDGKREAEGRIPECRIIRNNGFSEHEISDLEQYMSDNLATIKKMASGVDLLSAFMNDKKEK